MKAINKNVGDQDSAIRWAAGLSILALGLARRRWWGLLGVLPFYSAATRYCAINDALGIDTTENDAGQEASEMAPVKPIKLSRAESGARGPVHFEAKHPHPESDHTHNHYMNEHSTHVGNGPGERNQIGGRSSGQRARNK